jgi:hypothetical protein
LLGPPGVTPLPELLLPFGGETLPGIELVPFGAVLLGVVVFGVVLFGVVLLGVQPVDAFAPVLVLVLPVLLEVLVLLEPELIVPEAPLVPVAFVDVDAHGPFAPLFVFGAVLLVPLLEAEGVVPVVALELPFA